MRPEKGDHNEAKAKDREARVIEGVDGGEGEVMVGEGVDSCLLILRGGDRKSVV